MELSSATDLSSFKYSLNRTVTQVERKYKEENQREKKKIEETLSNFFSRSIRENCACSIIT